MSNERAALEWILRHLDQPEKAARGVHRGLDALKAVATAALQDSEPAWVSIQWGDGNESTAYRVVNQRIKLSNESILFMADTIRSESARSQAMITAAPPRPQAEDMPRPDWRHLWIQCRRVMDKWHAQAVELGYDGVMDLLDAMESAPQPQAFPDCGACKGDGSMCPKVCRHAEENPPADWAQAEPVGDVKEVKEVIEEMLLCARNCEPDWDGQLRDWATRLAAAPQPQPQPQAEPVAWVEAQDAIFTAPPWRVTNPILYSRQESPTMVPLYTTAASFAGYGEGTEP